jgi:3-phenylpropionate/trans-cinnamate dioxygenase ferredoxin subunit
LSDRVAVGDVESFESEPQQIVEVRGVELGIFNVDGQFHAVLNTCPHQNGPVAEGTLGQTVVADPPAEGERVEERYDPETTVLRCPCHSWTFDVATGENVAASGSEYDLVTYETAVEDGTVYVVL